jgi:plasmid replication initiation protein
MTDKQLIPDRYPQKDLFICDVADAVLKDIMPQMEHPFYSLSKKPETRIRRYEHGENWLEVVPSVKGLATIYDKDILIYAISQIMAKIKIGEEPGKRVRINSYELLQFTNRGTAGKDYKALNEALDRLAGTRITTNIITDDEEQIDGFGLIDTFGLRRKNGLDGRLLWCEITLSDWVFNAIKAKEVLTLHRDYFRLRKPIERRIYEIARKHCGHQKKWAISLKLLHKKSGSQATVRRFKQAIKNIVKHNHLPDYTIDYNNDSNVITFRNRDTWWKDKPSDPERKLPALDTETYDKAKKLAPQFDVYGLEQEFRTWWEKSNRPVPNDLEQAFLGFCKKRANQDRQHNLF